MATFAKHGHRHLAQVDVQKLVDEINGVCVNGGMDDSDGTFMNRVIDGIRAGKLLSDKSIGRLLAIHHKHVRERLGR